MKGRKRIFLVYCIVFLIITIGIIVSLFIINGNSKEKDKNSVNDKSLKTEKKIKGLQVQLEELKKQEKNETNSAEKKKLEVRINNLEQQIVNLQKGQFETPPSETPPSETPPSETPPSETPPSETPNEISEEEAKDKLFKVFEGLLPSDLKGNSLFTKENFVKMVEGSSLKLNFSGKKLNSLAELDSEIKECLEKNETDKIFSSLPSQKQFKTNFLLIKILRSFFFYILFSPRKSDGIIDWLETWKEAEGKKDNQKLLKLANESNYNSLKANIEGVNNDELERLTSTKFSTLDSLSELNQWIADYLYVSARQEFYIKTYRFIGVKLGKKPQIKVSNETTYNNAKFSLSITSGRFVVN